jgi:hypothetical protein
MLRAGMGHVWLFQKGHVLLFQEACLDRHKTRTHRHAPVHKECIHVLALVFFPAPLQLNKLDMCVSEHIHAGMQACCRPWVCTCPSFELQRSLHPTYTLRLLRSRACPCWETTFPHPNTVHVHMCFQSVCICVHACSASIHTLTQ